MDAREPIPSTESLQYAREHVPGGSTRGSMAEKGVPFAHECRVFEICNPHQAKKVRGTNLEISTALPCRISLYQEGELTKLATIKPAAMIDLHATPGLQEVGKEVEATLEGIMVEAAC